ncbi:MAG TPA: response regulator [Candidatus Binatia bacterium]
MNRAVLVADENVNAQIIAETLLRLRGLHVHLAGDGAEACDIVRREDIAVIVLDLDLPGMNGFEFLRRLRGRFGSLSLPTKPRTKPRILAVTDHQEPEVARFALRLGADAILRKPLAPGLFIETVEELIGSTAPQAE